MKLIREFDDFEWAKSNLVNPWVLGYTGIHFDIEPTRENLNQLIEMALTKTITNAHQWDEDSREDDINSIIDYFRSNGKSCLAIDSNLKLGYGEKKSYNGWENVKWIEYSKLIDNSLNENKKDDDFDWIRDTTPSFDENNTPSVGDVLICLPGYHNSPKGPYRSEQEDPQCAGAGYADGRIIVVGHIDLWLDSPEGKRLIIWPDEDESQMYWDYDDGEVCFECGVYGFALTYYTGDELMESIDSLDWIRDIDPNQPVSFHDAKIFKTYRFEGTDFLVEAVDTCGRDSGIYDTAETVVVRNSTMTPYHDVVCDTDDDRPVFSLQLEFHSKEGEYIDTFWVMEEMLTLYQTYGDLNESVDELDWIREIEPEIKLKPNTLYHFEPKLTVQEIETFTDNIANAPQFAQWLRDLPNANSLVAIDGGIKYLITRPDLPIRLQGWCTETSVGYAQSVYPGIKVVDARKEFNF